MKFTYEPLCIQEDRFRRNYKSLLITYNKLIQNKTAFLFSDYDKTATGFYACGCPLTLPKNNKIPAPLQLNVLRHTQSDIPLTIVYVSLPTTASNLPVLSLGPIYPQKEIVFPFNKSAVYPASDKSTTFSNIQPVSVSVSLSKVPSAIYERVAFDSSALIRSKFTV